MATSTTNLGLTKPAGTDKIRIAQINGNMDILDEKIGAVGNTSIQAQLTSQNEAISNLNSNANSTNDILADAVNVTTTKMFKGSGTNYTGTLPSATFKYATFIVTTRGDYKMIIAEDSSGNIATNACISNTWQGWHMLALKETVDVYNIGESTKSNIESALVTFGNTMANDEVRNIRFGITTAASPLLATTYFGTISRVISGRYTIFANGIASTNQNIVGCYRNSAWEWDTLNVKSSITSINNSSKTITFTGDAHFLLICEGSATSRQGVYLVRGQTAGTTVLPVVAGSALTVTVSANGDAITVSSNQSGNVYLYAIFYAGSRAWTVT